MSKELVIAANRHETKVAILEDDQLVEVVFQRANEYSLAGSIHKGRVTRVLPGMQSAFVDLGLERDTFLYVSDFADEAGEDFDRVSVTREGGRGDRGNRPPVEKPLAPEPASEGVEAVEGAAPAAAAGLAEADSTAPSQTERSERPDRGPDRGERPDRGPDRGDRGRRSRRRRGRGRGFPDSKYASSDASRPSRFPEAAPAAEPNSAPARPAADPETRPSVTTATGSGAGATDFSVLPGESLAKYTRSNIQPLDEAEEDEIRDLQETTVAPQAEALAEIAEEAVEEPDDAPVAADTAEDNETEVPEAFVEESAVEVDASEVEGESESEAEPAELEAGSQADGPGEESRQSDVAPLLSAQVREQGGRFPHRMPRRMRRKMRGAGPGESRPGESKTDDERRTDATAAAEPGETPAPRTEQRTYTRPEKAPLPSITELLKEGQEIIVQIAKEPLGQKGARITSHIALPGRYVVYMPTLEHIGVSRKIASDEERLRLKRILQTHHAGIPGRLHRPHGGRRQKRGRSRRRHELPLQPLAGHPPESREEARAAAAASRSRYRAAHSARSVHRRFQSHLGGQRRAV